MIPSVRPGAPTLALAALLLRAGAAPALAQPAAPATRVMFDAYTAGVHFAELDVTEGPGGRSCSIRKKDVAVNRWQRVRTAPGCRIADDSAFRLLGGIASLPARLQDFGRIPWTTLKAVGWPDANTIYVPHRQVQAPVDGQPRPATRWAVRDADQPLDLIVGSANELIAGIDLRRDLVFVRRGYEAFTTIERWRGAGVSPATSGYRSLGNVTVPMPDGARLATLVYLPEGGATGPYPTIFIRTAYGIRNLINGLWPYPARGFALVVQSVRGTASAEPEHRSDGVFGDLRNEAADGTAALEWITRQPWSNGDVCMQGGSYLAYTQWTASMAGNRALKCVISESAMGTAFGDQPFWGGGLVEGFAYYLFWMLGKPLRPGVAWTDVLRHRPLISLDEFATGEDIPQWNALLQHWRNDDYWRPQDWYATGGPRDFASLHISGWFDDDLPGTQANWALMRRHGTQPRRLLIGPWKHGYNLGRSLNGFSFGEDAVREDVRLLQQLWVDRFLKGRRNGVDERTVDYFVMGENRWQSARDWPPPESQPQGWYFHSRGDANGRLPAGTLTMQPPRVAEPSDAYTYDPARPVTNWMSFDLMESWEDQQSWPYDFKDIESRPDVVTYTSAPLEADLTVAGDIKLVLYASTDVKDTDWWVHVSDVHPDNQSVRLTMGVLRARFRAREDPQHGVFGANYRTEELLSGNPDEVVRYEIGLRASANTFRKGHRIRVAVMNALANYEFPNSNTGGDEALATKTVVGKMRIHHTPEHPTHIVLPVMPSPPGTRDR